MPSQEASAAPLSFSTKDVLDKCNMTAEEYQAVMAPNDAWAWAASEDAWAVTHDTIRADMRDFADALQAVIDRLVKGEAVQPWVIKNLKTWYALFEKHIHHHHDNEEQIAFPELAKVTSLPPKMSADHETLMADLTAVTTLMGTIKPDQSMDEHKASFKALLDKYQAMKASMEEHLLEEEEIGLPLCRKAMTYKQFKPTIEKRIVAGLTPADLGWVLRPFADDVARKAWMTKVLGIPGLVQSLIMLPATHKYIKNVQQPLEDVRSGQQTLPKRTFACFAA